MDAASHSLWQRIEAFEVDRPDATLTYTARLARDNGWSRDYARRVVAEYKRFMFLATVADHIVTPSEAVDQAWHLHLTYTRSYWQDFCGVLGRKVHHDPTTGLAEQAKFIDLYDRTLATYERWFGHPPPADIWPAAHVRFGEDLRNRWVNVSRNWVVPKPRFVRRFAARRRRGVAVGIAAMPPLIAAANPFDFKGADFLAFYGVLFVLAVVAAWIARRLLTDDASLGGDEELSPNEAAFLAGGMERALHATIAAMLQARQVTINERPKSAFFSTGVERRLVKGEPLHATADALEHAVYDAASTLKGAKAEDLGKAATKAFPILRDQLVERGLVGRHPLVDPSRIVPALILWTVAGVGVVKIFVGIARHKPVGFLVAATIVTVLVSLWFLARQRVTGRGELLVDQLRTRKKDLASAAASNDAAMNPTDLALAVALFGVSVASVGQLADTATAIQSFNYPSWRNSGGGCGAGCGNGCGAGGGCGGGGGGCGGGCGGCGGCGG